MRLVATSDTHYPLSMKVPDGDVFVHAGDFMRTGYPDEWRATIAWFRHLPHATKILVPGNHDFHLQVYPGPALQDLREVGVTVVGLPGNDHYTSVTLSNGMSLLGLPYVYNNRWAFDISPQELEAHLSRVWNDAREHQVIVSHSPVHGILDATERGPAGIEVYRKWLPRKPRVWISGHIHESYGSTVVDGCRFYNVSMCDRSYTQANPPAVIDL